MAASAHRPTIRKVASDRRPYVLSGLVFCGQCGRRMQGQWNHNTAYYRCRYPNEYAIAKELDHPRTVYVREEAITEGFDAWLSQLFNEDNLDTTCEALAMAGDRDDAAEARSEAARRKLADCGQRLAKYRAALDAGADPVVAAGWMAEVQGERLRAEVELGRSQPIEGLTKEEVRTLVKGLGEIASVLRTADPKDKADIYAKLGVRITYRRDTRIVIAESNPVACATERVGEAFDPLSTPVLLQGEVLLRAV
jgi:hypothetical protein